MTINYGKKYVKLNSKKGSLKNQLKLASNAFDNQEEIPNKYRFDYGQNINPPFKFNSIPVKTNSLALIIEDLDSPSICINWVLWNIPPTTEEIFEGKIPQGAVVGKNFLDSNSFYGFCPLQGRHNYSFILFALDRLIDIESDSSISKVFDEIFDHIIDYDELIGYCEKIGEFILE
ncbi:MAG: hypothetical protein HeimC2_27540 [Candidatus Heimdallarchaeota archaeon LC_2]|nr:MAG: hypothetical protein HeimC2_27540 [Candidatus Heimdallarchaeota archaeon LC_2]